MAAPAYTVDSYFLNVGAGDSAIHVVVNRGGPQLVERVVLIDGGLSKQQIIRQAIATLEAKYQFRPIKFDAIVVSHWDNDHYEGVRRLIAEDLANQTAGSLKGFRSSLMKYGAKGSEDEFQTTFYCPDKYKHSDFDTENKISGQTHLTIKVGKEDSDVLCKSCVSDECIGVNLFTGKPYPKDKPNMISLERAHQHHPDLANKNAEAPVLLCVGIDQQFAGSAKSQPSAAEKKASKEDGHFVVERDKKDDAYHANAASLLALLLWPGGKSAKDRKVSLYTGGDAEEDEEANVIDWLSPVKKISTWKLGHHGTPFSTDWKFQSMSVNQVIISAGRKHGHPGWPTLWFLLALAKLRNDSKPPLPPLGLFATRPPYWFLEPEDSEHLFTGIFTSSKGTTFWSKMRSLAPGVMDWFDDAKAMVDDSTYMEVDTDKESTEKSDFQKALIERVAVEWDNIGVPKTASTGEVDFILVTSTPYGQDDEKANMSASFVPYIGVFKSVAPNKSVKAKVNLNDSYREGDEYLGSRSRGTSNSTKTSAKRKRQNAKNVESKRKKTEMMARTAMRVESHPASSYDDQVLAVYTDYLATVVNTSNNKSGWTQSLPLPHAGDDTSDWFRRAMGISQTGFSGAIQNGIILISDMDLILSDESTTYSLTFTTAKAAYLKQFGEHVGSQHSKYKAGVNDVLVAQIFCLDVAAISGPSTLGQFWDIIGFEGFSTELRPLFDLVPIQIDTGDIARSFITFQPNLNRTLELRLQATAAIDINKNNDFIILIRKYLPDITLEHLTIIGRKTAVCIENLTKSDTDPGSTTMNRTSSLYLQMALSLGVAGKSYNISVTMALHSTGYDFIVQFPSDTPKPKDLLSWLNDTLKKSLGTGKDFIPDASRNAIGNVLDTITDSCKPREFRLSIEDEKITTASARFAIPLNFGAPAKDSASPEGYSPVVDASVLWQPHRLVLSGSLWELIPETGDFRTPRNPTTVPFEMNPYREKFFELDLNIPNAVDHIDLRYIHKDNPITDWPAGFPEELIDVSVSLEFGVVPFISLGGTVQCGPQPPSDVPPVELDKLTLSATYYFERTIEGTPPTTVPSSFTMDLRGDVFLYPRAEDSSDPIILTVEVTHDPVWEISASCDVLPFGHLYSMFDPDGQQDAVMNIMQKISIARLSVDYAIGGNGSPSSLNLKGALILGSIELDLVYTHTGKSKDTLQTVWNVHAELKESAAAAASNSTVKLGDLLADLAPTENIPSYIGNIEIPVAELSITIDCLKSATDPKHIIFCLDIGLSDFHLSYVQMQNHQSLTPENRATAQPTRMLRLALTKLPAIGNVPLVAQLEQPFDQMDFIWLSADLTQNELDILNTDIYTPKQETLMFKSLTPSPPAGATTPGSDSNTTPTVVGIAGCHFQIIMNEDAGPTVVLDHVFNQPSPQSASPSQPPAGGSGSNPPPDGGTSGGTSGGEAPPVKTPESPGDATTAPVNKSFASLSIKNLGLSMKEHVLSISVDATVELGPVGFSLLGLTILIDLDKCKNVKTFFQDGGVDFALHGLALQYNEPPTTIAGLFEKIDQGNIHGFAGGVVLNVEPYSFMAAGAYENVTVGTSSYKSVFVFAKLNGPLVELEFAEITGVTAGFGYNSSLRFPRVSEVMSFPFVSISTGATPVPGGSTPMDQIEALVSGTAASWITPQDKSIWLAAGLEIKAFQSVMVQAVLAVDITKDPKIGIIAEAVAVVPEDVPQAEQFLLVDLGITAILEPTLGILAIAGQLTPRSFVLNPSCKLTGGFALSYWFKGSDHAGDWVFSVGGYHPAFQPPSHYPVPPRLGISWSYDANLSIGGEAYFAITPQMCMGGGKLSAIFNKGDLDATMTAYADFLIKYKPFTFTGDAGVDVNVNYKIGVGKLKTKVHIEASADLNIWGPPLAGKATVKVWFVKFHVHFGPTYTAVNALDIEDFYSLLKQTTKGSPAPALAMEDNEKENDHVLSVTSGNAVPSGGVDAMKVDAPEKTTWFVRAPKFAFQVNSKFPITSTKGVNALDSEIAEPAFDCKPMQTASVQYTSKLIISVTSTTAGTSESPVFGSVRINKEVPAALWTAYDHLTDPALGSTDLLNSKDVTVQKLMGLTLTPPPPTVSADPLPAYNAKVFNQIDINQGADPEVPIGPAPVTKFSPVPITGSNESEKIGKAVKQLLDPANMQARTSVLQAYSKLLNRPHLRSAAPKEYLKTVGNEWRVSPVVTAA